MNPLQQQLDALQATVAALTTRVQNLEGHDAATASTGDALNDYAQEVQERLQKARRERGGNYALAVTSAVSQINNTGHSGTAYGLTTLDHRDELATDENIEANVARVRLFVTDTLVLRCLRELVALCFEGKPMEATSADLATRLGTDAGRIDAVLGPLVQNNMLQRGLRPDNTPFYQWDGNEHFPMSLIC